MKTFRSKISFIAALSLLFASANGFASIGPGRGSQPTSQAIDFSPNSQDFSRGYDISTVHPMESLRDTKSEDVAKIIPAKDMHATSDSRSVASIIIDHSIASFLDSPGVRNSEIGRSANDVQRHMEKGVAFGGEEPDSTKHEFKFALQAAQGKATVQYKGYTNAELSYEAAQSTAKFEINEKVAALDSQLVYDHLAMPSENRDVLSMRWVW